MNIGQPHSYLKTLLLKMLPKVGLYRKPWRFPLSLDDLVSSTAVLWALGRNDDTVFL
jgi:hypothetical protein